VAWHDTDLVPGNIAYYVESAGEEGIEAVAQTPSLGDNPKQDVA